TQDNIAEGNPKLPKTLSRIPSESWSRVRFHRNYRVVRGARLVIWKVCRTRRKFFSAYASQFRLLRYQEYA
ncbi:MAG: hypothetical protein LBL72_00980, partial [Candidatus Accumulibacter sp.]|nr:hypothetical protein [Accumulibacter sp.]